MAFIDIKKDIYLSVPQMNAIYNNFVYLKETLESAGFTVGELSNNEVDYKIGPMDILQKFQAVENNIQLIHSVLFDIYGTNEKHYKEFTWQPTTGNRKAEVWRWIDWLYEAKSLASKYAVLFDINGEEITDVNDERILVLQEVK